MKKIIRRTPFQSGAGCFHHGGKLIISGNRDFVLDFWDRSTGRYWTIPHSFELVSELSMSWDGKTMAACVGL